MYPNSSKIGTHLGESENHALYYRLLKEKGTGKFIPLNQREPYLSIRDSRRIENKAETSAVINAMGIFGT